MRKMEKILENVLSELKDLKLDVNMRLDAIEGKQDALSADVTRLNHTIEPQLKVIQEGIEGIQEKFDRLDRVEAKQEEHDHRIWALEQAK